MAALGWLLNLGFGGTGEGVAASFDGPDIDDLSAYVNVAMTPVDVSDRFSGVGLTFDKTGSWPTGVTVTSAGVIQGTPTVLGTYTGLRVTADDGINPLASSNAFSFTVREKPQGVSAMTVLRLMLKDLVG